MYDHFTINPEICNNLNQVLMKQSKECASNTSELKDLRGYKSHFAMAGPQKLVS